METTTSENLRKSIDELSDLVLSERQKNALDNLINASHALGILGLKYQRLKNDCAEKDKLLSVFMEFKWLQEADCKLKDAVSHYKKVRND